MKNLILIGFLSLASCASYECDKELLNLAYVGYLPNEADTIIVKYYQKNSNFSVLKDSVLLMSSSFTIRGNSDTSYVLLLRNDNINYINTIELKVINPTDNKTTFISDIRYERNEGSKGLFSEPRGCVSPIISYKVNGIFKTFAPQRIEDPIVYISK